MSCSKRKKGKGRHRGRHLASSVRQSSFVGLGPPLLYPFELLRYAATRVTNPDNWANKLLKINLIGRISTTYRMYNTVQKNQISSNQAFIFTVRVSVTRNIVSSSLQHLQSLIRFEDLDKWEIQLSGIPFLKRGTFL